MKVLLVEHISNLSKDLILDKNQLITKINDEIQSFDLNKQTKLIQKLIKINELSESLDKEFRKEILISLQLPVFNYQSLDNLIYFIENIANCFDVQKLGDLSININQITFIDFCNLNEYINVDSLLDYFDEQLKENGLEAKLSFKLIDELLDINHSEEKYVILNSWQNAILKDLEDRQKAIYWDCELIQRYKTYLIKKILKK
ncbi:hypothetical protein FOY66_01460 [Mycoplasma capricolum subsp. capripneumoniae]|uniref:Uncharacterized protein n=1 Tax=Mycoplasma capricolum subsp. capripneumoniae 87001 TaxID=1124992 RepID=A0A9N7G8C9_MYCCC|nr:hypothetical protein [Mycoplasma capricolum]AJK51307.1 hypothetical protein MCCG_0330 [Mycoplasma capricolum subsp. capripneumoniae 87001]AOQ22012.1 hypothetical protein M1601_01465 [Mycoplasma capricolum subsp. capripneumoniae M1601]AQU77415.1 hypothetical protein BVA24_01470 [Mycoplasma capricolum subsp. capripneumoniae]KEY84240.1 hypothetical protein MCCP_8150 [Mycoplasma capricolum subsp. capripneumoniae 99108]QDL19494.1 hypothetical protein DQW15_01470 [Mycoplasma capricolum subsp. cap